jgi:hypothetical protein
MVNLTSIVLGRPPHLIYGVKRGKVPTSLRPHVILKKQALGSEYFHYIFADPMLLQEENYETIKLYFILDSSISFKLFSLEVQ